jgi:hypothetical protein
MIFKERRITLYKHVYIVTLLSVLLMIPSNTYAQFLEWPSINNVTATESSGEKPQSKVWNYYATWWAVFPVNAQGGDPSGTYLWRLDGNIWTKLLFLSSDKYTQADCKAVGNVSHIFLFSGTSSELVSVEHVISGNTYQSWSSRTDNVPITLTSDAETSTIDIDSNNRMWLAFDTDSTVNLRWSGSPYSNWSSDITLASIAPDDICAVTAFDGNKIGVMWSNQTVSPNKFGFRYRIDSISEPAENDFNADEVPASQSELGVGNGMADDHINFAVGSDGSIYLAVKTAYDLNNYPMVALLVRRSSPISGDNHWENLHNVRVRDGNNIEPTRPIVLLDDDHDKIYVVYAQDVNGDDIMYKHSSSTSISFPADTGIQIISNDTGNDWDDVASTKQNFNSEVVIVASDGNLWTGVRAALGPLPVELAFFTGSMNGNNIDLRWRTETELNNYGFYIERATEYTEWITIGFVEGYGNSNSPKYYSFNDDNIFQSANYKYRLKQTDNDGTFEYSDMVTVIVGPPVLYSLSQNYPNPFNPETRIDYTLPEQQNVTLNVYNMLGELVAELVNEVKPAGTYTVTFDPSSVGSGLPSGIYIYVLRTPDFVSNRKMTFLK